MEQNNQARTASELRLWNEAQKKEALSADNFWYAGQWLGRKPTAREAVRYYFFISDGPKNFAERHGISP